MGRVYHHASHAGLVDPLESRVELSPAEMFARGIAAAGRIRLPASADLIYDFLEVEWRSIHCSFVACDHSVETALLQTCDPQVRLKVTFMVRPLLVSPLVRGGVESG